VATIRVRRLKNGKASYVAQVRITRAGRVIVDEAKAFPLKAMAAAWSKKRESELAKPGVLERRSGADPTLADVIQKALDTSKRVPSRTKRQTLEAIAAMPIGSLRCSRIDSKALSDWVIGLSKDRQPATVANYLSHLRAVWRVAKPVWGYPLDEAVINDASVALKRLGVVGTSNQRDRRPTLDELDRLLTLFARRSDIAVPMTKIYSTRRQEEICNLRWTDLETDRVLVRDMKHPDGSAGNHARLEVPPEAMRVIHSMPRVDEHIFPTTPNAIGAAWWRACGTVGVEDLHFHDLRHHGISRQFEMGKTIPQVASVSGHRNWQSLKRYTHLRQTGDCHQE
jgi:integrase